MAPLRVVRVEHETARDEWSEHFVGPRKVGWPLLDANQIPDPTDDGLDADEFTDSTVFAFRGDQWDTKSWFTRRDRELLTRNGFVARCYAVPAGAVRHGGHQVVVDAAVLAVAPVETHSL